MKIMIKLLIFSLLMQHGVAQASWANWISDELFGRKQARIMHDLDKGEFFNYEQRVPLKDRPMMSSEDIKGYVENQEIFKQKSENGVFDNESAGKLEALVQKERAERQNHKEKFVINQYKKLYKNAEYVKSRRDFIAPFASLGCSSLKVKQSNNERQYHNENYLTEAKLLTYYRNKDKMDYFYDHIAIYKIAARQFDCEQQAYQNKVVAAGVFLSAVSIAGYIWANKK